MPVAYVENGRLRTEGRDLREFGVNTPDLLIAWLGGPNGSSPRAPWSLTSPAARDTLLGRLRDAGLRFIRFAPFGSRPLTFQSAFFDNRAAFLDAFDNLVASAERHDMALIPSLFFSQTQIPPIFGEPLPAFADPSSRSYETFAQVIDVIVPRYRNSHAIGYWELGNEFDIRIGMPIPDYSVDPAMGTPAHWTSADATPLDYCHKVTARFQQLVRAADSAPAPGGDKPRAIASGLQGWRWPLSRRYDWPRHLDTLLYDDQTETQTIHPYDAQGWHNRDYVGLMLYLSQLRQDLAKRGKPLIVGEFGVPLSFRNADVSSAQRLGEVIDQIDTSRAQLALIWAMPTLRGLIPDYDQSFLLSGSGRPLKALSP